MTWVQILAQLQAASSNQTRHIYRRRGFGDIAYGVSYAKLGKPKSSLPAAAKTATTPTGSPMRLANRQLRSPPPGYCASRSAQLSPSDAPACAITAPRTRRPA